MSENKQRPSVKFLTESNQSEYTTIFNYQPNHAALSYDPCGPDYQKHSGLETLGDTFLMITQLLPPNPNIPTKWAHFYNKFYALPTAY